MGTYYEDIKGKENIGQNVGASSASGKDVPVVIGSDDDFNASKLFAKGLFKVLGKWYYPFNQCLAGISGIGALVLALVMDNSSRGLSSMAIHANVLHFATPLGACLVLLCFALLMMSVPSESKCPQCKEPFRMSETHREMINKSEDKDQTVYVFTIHEKCSKCGHKRSHHHEELVWT
jgi:phage FluMu protein Com